MNSNNTKELLYKDFKEIVLYDLGEGGCDLVNLLECLPYHMELSDTLQETASDKGYNMDKDTNYLTLASEYLERLYNELKKENILTAIIDSDMRECLDSFETPLDNRKNVNKIDLFWLEQLQQEVKNVIHRVKVFNQLD